MPEITLNSGELLTFSTALTTTATATGTGNEAQVDAYYTGGGQLSLVLPEGVSLTDSQTPIPFN